MAAMKKKMKTCFTERSLENFCSTILFFVFFFFCPTRAKYQEIVRAHLWNVGGSWSTWRDTRGGEAELIVKHLAWLTWAPLRSQE